MRCASDLPLTKTLHVWLPHAMPKQHFTAMACNSKPHAILWYVISAKLNIGKKITEIEIMTWICKKI